MHTTIDFFDLLLDADAVSDVPARVYDRMMRDIQILADRLGASSDARRLVAWLDGDRQRYGDLIDVALSTAETASLTSFRRPGELWRMEIVEEHTAAGCALTAAMHHLRALLLARPYLQSSIYRANIPADLKRALAILVLSLDAAPAHIQPALAITAGLGRTGDPVGDAQLAAEELFAAHEWPPLPDLGPSKESSGEPHPPPAELFALS
ncbi:hypothetical protein LOS78_12815 [Paracoccus sp. MA]|uniref:hypothetical protein n=1 Tax=Paracoccus sp. MA TaxID=2895796 RepID=UPI001E30C6C7|nr:hypothetical protein [Paracoccus sp. MA]UFM66808.1 hypothetical protein LOS78_12815 [Paracoccus sp. MA]